jgi:hypothetical protein
VWCVLIAAATPLTGCDRAIEGNLQASGAGQQAAPGPPKTLAELIIQPGQFPPRYPATALEPTSVGQAIGDIDAVTAAAVLEPPQCAPAPPGPSPSDAVAVRGTDAVTSTTLTVTLTRTRAPLSQRRDQLLSCSTFTATIGDQVSTVTVTLLPAPPVDADDTFAVGQTVESPDGETNQQTVLSAQIGDVRVTAAWLAASEDVIPDTESLDAVFTDAVLRVRRDARP